ASFGSIYAQREGVFTRGVLLDIAAARGVPWLETDQFVTVTDFEQAEARQHVRVSSGDALLVRVGLKALEAAHGEQDISPSAGLNAECVEWMHHREVALFG